MRRHLSALLVTGAAISFALAGCSKDEASKKPPAPPAPPKAEKPGGEGTDPSATPEEAEPRARVQVPSERTFAMAEGGPEFLDPNLTSESSGTRIITQAFEQLAVFAPGKARPVPGAAESWTRSEDGKTWTFQLRKDAKWSDGKPITSKDWMYSFERALNPNTRSRNAQQYWIIEGAKAYNVGDTTDFGTVGIKAPDAHTLELTLLSPAPYFLDLITYAAFSPVPQHVIEKHGEQWVRPENMVSNGAFRMAFWRHGDRIELEKNPNYWDAENVWLNKVVFYETDSEAAADDWYQTGKVHWTPGLVPLEKGRQRLKEGRDDLHIDPILCTYYYVFNTEVPPFDDVRVRRAFNMAFDKGTLTRQVLGLGQQPATHLVPPHFEESRGYGEVRGDPFNPDEAKKLLKEAGYGEGGKPFPKVTLLYNTYEGHRLIAQFYQRSLQKHLGVDVDINNMEWKSLLQTVHAGEFQIARTSWCADFPDPENFLQVFHSEGENNYSRYKNPEYDAALNELLKTGDQEKRNQLTAKLESMLNRDVPLSPFYFYTRAYMLKPFVRGLEPDINDRHNFKFIWFGQPGEDKPE